MLTTRSPVLPSGINHFSRSWLLGAVVPWFYLFINNIIDTIIIIIIIIIIKIIIIIVIIIIMQFVLLSISQ